jgi:hypothetical protein
MQTFLRCKKTGHVTWTTHGYVFWSPCAKCGWNNNKEQTFSDHWEVLHLETTKAQERILYGTRKTSGILDEWIRRKEAELEAGKPLQF